MQNLFDIINDTLPKNTTAVNKSFPETNQAPLGLQTSGSEDLSKIKTKDLIIRWQKENSPELTAAVLKRMKPTIDSALHSYASGQEDQLRIKATKLTLDTLKKYDANAGAEASTFVFNNLKRLNRLSAKSSSIMPLPEGVVFDANKIQKASDKFVDQEGRDPSDQELADLTGLSIKRINKVRESNKVVSESSTLSTEGGRDTVSISATTDKDYFEYVYASVDPINQKIMEWSAGAHGQPRMKDIEIAKRLKISPAAVTQRKIKIQRLMSDVRTLV